MAALNGACQAGDVHMCRIDSDENVADFFTKGLGGQNNSKFGSESLGYDLSFLYTSRKSKNPTQKEGEQSSALLLSQKEGEQSPQTSTLPLSQKEGEPSYLPKPQNEGEQTSKICCIPDWEILPKVRESPKDIRERNHLSEKEGELKAHQEGVTVRIEYSGGRGFKVDNNTNLDYQVDDNEEAMKIHYVSLAEKYAKQGNEFKFNMYFKLAKFLGHRPKS